MHKNISPLFDPRREHDACGVGFLARLDAMPTHAVVEEAVMALERMAHRGCSTCGTHGADGAGLLLPLPERFLRRVWQPLIRRKGDGVWPEKYGVGQFFLPQDAVLRGRIEGTVKTALAEHDLEVLAWRDTPVRSDLLQPRALSSMPAMRQAVIAPTEGMPGDMDAEAFERLLYLVRRHMEYAVRQALAAELGEDFCLGEYFHAASLSSRGIVYKGMLPGGQLAAFYPDLADRDFCAHFAIFHERYSTNTRPSWRLAQPFNRLAHNGEINTLTGNQAHMSIREPLLDSKLFTALHPEAMRWIRPVLDHTASDSAMLDSALELLTHGGRSLSHAAMMLLPEAFGASFVMGDDKRAFYEYHAALMEPWDGPAALVFTDGNRQVGAMLDRNALRPCRYAVTSDGVVLLASEAGVLDLPPERVVRRGRLQPRRMLLVDFSGHRVITDAECKSRVIFARPYRHWVQEKGLTLRDLPLPARRRRENDHGPAGLQREQRLHGYGKEELEDILAPMARDGQEPVGSMGLDIPLAVLSQRPQLLFDYLKQRFAQVTNPPIDPLREGMVMSLMGFAGRRGNLLEESPEHYAMLRLANPVLFPEDMERIRASGRQELRSACLPMLFMANGAAALADARLELGLAILCATAEKALADGASILILCDAGADKSNAPIPSLLAVSALHHHLLRKKLRHACGLIVDCGDAREVMHLAQLIAFGAAGVCPRLAFASLESLAESGRLGKNDTPAKARNAYATALQKGLLKTFSRMGISTLRSFQAGQAFEALGLGRELVDKYFTGLPSRIGGIDLQSIALDSLARHAQAYAADEKSVPLTDTGRHRHRKDGEKHLWSPAAIRAMHKAVRENDLESYKAYAKESDEQLARPVTLRGLLRFARAEAIPLAEVESEESILRRFTGAAMSYGSISPEAHQAIAMAFNRLGGRSNCGEGGEAPERSNILPDGRSARSRVRQVASGRFGVTAFYLTQADEIQIKMAQGAKPGEGGQLPARKVLPDIARVRRTIPGVTLISPPPHHDIYSIEDLAQLIFDLKRLHPGGLVSVKLVAGSNVGTVACGVAKAGADVILISGHDGGTGASPRSAISHVGLPWELGLAESHAALTYSGLRGRVILQTDGQLRTGRDLAVAALLGAQEFGFGAGLLVALGCRMLRVCHQGSCPMGVAAQDPRLRARFGGQPEHVERYLRFLAADLRRHMAALGCKSLDAMLGRADLLEPVPPTEIEAALPPDSLNGVMRAAWLGKVAGLDFSSLLAPVQIVPDLDVGHPDRSASFADSSLESAILAAVRPAIDSGRPVRFEGRVRNTDRSLCARLSGEIARCHGEAGLSPGAVEIHLTGTAGQSAGAFLARGVFLKINGEANDYAGKGLCGGVIAIAPEQRSGGDAFGEQAAIGNVALYGATSGELYVAGTAGERFAVRNSGATAVVEGVGDHACEYMTGGVVVVLGSTGCNFAAGMSGGAAYVLDRSEMFQTRCNMDSVDIESVWRAEDVRLLRGLLERHARHTGSALAAGLLRDWEACLPLFLKVSPIEYRHALARLKDGEGRHAESVAATEEVYNP